MGIKKGLYGIGDDFLKGMRKGFSPRNKKVGTSFKEKDIKAGARRIFGKKPGPGNFSNLGY